MTFDEHMQTLMEGAVERVLARAKNEIADEVARKLRDELGAMELLSPRSVQRRYDIAPETLRRWVRQGLLKRYGKGNRVRVDRRELEALLKQADQAAGGTLSAEERDKLFAKLKRKVR